MNSWDDDDDDGLPDDAFTQGELAAGVQHIVRTGNPDATSSGRRPVPWSQDHRDAEPAEDADDVLSSRSAAPLRFETFAQARAWSQANPGKVFTRAADGCGFESKAVLPVLRVQSVSSHQPEISVRQLSSEITGMAPHLGYVLFEYGFKNYGTPSRPFSRSTWEDELSQLSTAQLSRLRFLVAFHLEKRREWLRQIYRDIRRFPSSMKAGRYGEARAERLNKFIEEALRDIDKRLGASRGDDWEVPF